MVDLLLLLLLFLFLISIFYTFKGFYNWEEKNKVKDISRLNNNKLYIKSNK